MIQDLEISFETLLPVVTLIAGAVVNAEKEYAAPGQGAKKYNAALETVLNGFYDAADGLSGFSPQVDSFVKTNLIPRLVNRVVKFFNLENDGAFDLDMQEQAGVWVLKGVPEVTRHQKRLAAVES